MKKINYGVACSSEYRDAGGTCRVGSVNDGEKFFGYDVTTYMVAWSPRGE